MATACRSGSPQLGSYCPDDSAIRALVSADQLSGHPDFERSVGGTYPRGVGPPGSYVTPYSRPGVEFPLTYLNVNNRSLLYPLVTSTLAVDPSGIRKMQYCDNSNREGYLCDFDFIAQGKPRPRYQRTVSAPGTRIPQSTTEDRGTRNRCIWTQTRPIFTRFDAANPVQNPLNNNFVFDPITQNQLQPSFPMSPFEQNGFLRADSYFTCSSYNASTCFRAKYSFTTEIHSFFEYQGGETFRFAGTTTFMFL